MRTIAITNQKGGSGKTTTAVNLAAALAERRRRILLVDLDPQASASQWLGIADAAGPVPNVLSDRAGLAQTMRATACEGVCVVPASASLAESERALAREVRAETILRRKVAAVSPADWDYIFVDCPPALGMLTLNALAAVHEVLVPVEAHVMALRGVAQLLGTLEGVRDGLNPELRLSGIVACRVDARTRHAQEVVDQLRARFGDVVYQTVIRENVRLAEAPSFGEPITRYDGRSAGAADYRALASEVIEQEGSR